MVPSSAPPLCRQIAKKGGGGERCQNECLHKSKLRLIGYVGFYLSVMVVVVLVFFSSSTEKGRIVN